MKFSSVELNCSIFFSLYCLLVSKKTDHFLREIVRSESLFWWLNVNPSSFVYRKKSWCINKFSLSWLCFCLWSGCNNLDTCLWHLIFLWICRNFCIVLIWIDHVFDRSIGYSDPRLRIVLIHRPDSNFNSIFEVLKTNWSWLPIQVQFSYLLESILLVVKLEHLEVKCIRDKPVSEIV